MTAPFIQVEYQTLEAIAARFEQHAESNAVAHQRLRRQADRLRDSWQGKGVTAFLAEMDGKLLPAYQRLVDALTESAATTHEILRIMREAEEKAAAPFQGSDYSTVNDSPAHSGEIDFDTIPQTKHKPLRFSDTLNAEEQGDEAEFLKAMYIFWDTDPLLQASGISFEEFVKSYHWHNFYFSNPEAAMQAAFSSQPPEGYRLATLYSEYVLNEPFQPYNEEQLEYAYREAVEAYENGDESAWEWVVAYGAAIGAIAWAKDNAGGASQAYRARLFERAGIQTHPHFLHRVNTRGNRGISEREALNAYNSGRLFYDPKYKTFIRYDSKTGIAVATTQPTGGTALSVFEGPPSPRWQHVRWRP